MDAQKLSFLREGMTVILKPLEKDTQARWGKMNPQQMLEHLADFFEVSCETIIFPLAVPEEHLPKYKQFLLSDKSFRENTKAPASVLGEEPLPVKLPSLAAAKENLQSSVEHFVQWFENAPGKTSVHPAFGPLNFEEWVLLHYKHVRHHFKQFGLME